MDKNKSLSQSNPELANKVCETEINLKKPENFCRLSTTPDKSCVCVDKNWCKACNTGFAGTFYQSFEVCPCPSQMQPVIRKSRMDELIDEFCRQFDTTGLSKSAVIEKVFAPAVDALERLENAKKDGMAVMRDGTVYVVVKNDKQLDYVACEWKLVGYVVEDK